MTATVDYQAGARGSVRNVCDRDLQPWHWRLSAFGSRYLQIQPLDLRTSSEKKRKACQYVTCIGTMLFFDGAGTVGSGETALEAACAGCHRCIYIVGMRS